LAKIHCALVAVITCYGLTITSGDRITGVGGTGIIVVAVQSGMAAAGGWIAGVGGAGIIVVAVHSSMATACGWITSVGGASIIIVAVHRSMATARSWIAGVGGAGIIVVAVYGDMAAACKRITGISSASISVVTTLAPDIRLAIHSIDLIYDLILDKNGLSLGLGQPILLQCRRGGIDASGRAANVNGTAVAIVAAYCFVMAAFISPIIPGAGIAVIAIYSGVWNVYRIAIE
jgi:hypothetical protein